MINSRCYFLSVIDSQLYENNNPVHVINIDIQDNHEEATIGAFLICELASMVSLHRDQTENLELFFCSMKLQFCNFLYIALRG